MKDRLRRQPKEKALPLVAIIGRPNVGKSTLFNRLIGERRAIVGDEPGITRDRIYGEANWRAQRFALVDTGGIVPDDEAVIPANILKQASFAIDDARALIWVVDARKGITPLDEELARLLRSTGKRVLTAANKADATHWESDAGEFHRFGFAEVFPISAEHGNGIGDMLDALVGDVQHAGRIISEDQDAGGTPALPVRPLRLAIVGRPNVGKSSLLNRFLGEERAVVSAVAGTTRDAVDSLLVKNGKQYLFVDTAGIRRQRHLKENVDHVSVVQARRALE